MLILVAVPLNYLQHVERNDVRTKLQYPGVDISWIDQFLRSVYVVLVLSHQYSRELTTVAHTRRTMVHEPRGLQCEQLTARFQWACRVSDMMGPSCAGSV